MILANTTDPLTFGPRDVRSHTAKQFFSTDNHPWRDDKGFCSREIRLTDFWCHRNLKWPAKRHQEDCSDLWHIPSRSGMKAWDNINTRQKKNNPCSTSNFVKILILKKEDIFRKVLRGRRRKKAKHSISIQIIRTFFPRYSSVLATPWPGMRRRGMARGVRMEGCPVTRCMIRGSWTTRTPILVRLSLQMLLRIYSPTDSLQNIRFSSLFADRDVSRGVTSATQR